MLNKTLKFKAVYENSLDAWVPEVWANESILVLIENMIAANLVHRDFANQIASYGDVVNTRKPAEFEGKRKVDTDSVTVQDASATNIPVKLDQHFHVSFMIKDGEDSKSFQDLVSEYLRPAVVALAQSIDKVVLGQAPQFMANIAGGLGMFSSSTAKDYIIDLRGVLNVNKAYVTGRNLIIGSNLETTALKDDSFTDADRVGDDGTALREASLGRKLGFNIFMCQNASEYINSDTATASAVQVAAAAGATTLTLTDGANITVGDTFTVVGDMVPHIVTSEVDTSGSGADTVTFTPALKRAVEAAAVVTIYKHCHVDGAQLINYAKYVHIDGWTTGKTPVVGQIIKLGSYVYTIIDVANVEDASGTGDPECDILLDRPLDAALSDDDVVIMYPSGNYGLAFHRNAIAFVSRPLATPKAGTGALSATANANGVVVRITITYNGEKQGHLVTVDVLCGIKVLDTALGAVLLG